MCGHACRKDPETRGHFMTMLSSTSLQLVLLIGEILIAVNLDLDTTRTLSWSAIFTPFYILVILSSVSCVLSCCCCRKFSIEVSVQGVVTPIDSVQTPATGVKNWVKQSKPKIWKVKRSKAQRKLEKVKGQAQKGQPDTKSHQSTIPHLQFGQVKGLFE